MGLPKSAGLPHICDMLSAMLSVHQQEALTPPWALEDALALLGPQFSPHFEK